jgi:hypothetical protein
VLEDDSTVAVACDLLPEDQVIGQGGQGLELGAHARLKAVQRRVFRSAGGEPKAIGLGTLLVGALYLGVIEAGLHDARLQVVGHDPVGYPAEEGEGVAMELNLCRQRLIEAALHSPDADYRPGSSRRPKSCGTPR